MADLIKKKKQEEEEKRRREAQAAKEQAKAAVVKPAQASSAKVAAVKQNATNKSTRVTGAVAAGNTNNASIHNQLGSNVNASNNSTMKVDMSKIKTAQQAANVAMRISTDAERDVFLKDFQNQQKKATGTKPRIDDLRSMVDSTTKSGVYAKTVAKRQEEETARRNQLKSLSGLYDANGKAININTASYATVVQGIRSIADATKRKEAAAKLEEMTKTWGSRFYGQTYTPGIVTSYLGNPEFDEAKYKEVVKAYDNAFYAQSGYDEQNAQQYLSFYNAIQDGAYTDSVKRQLKEALDASWQNTTGRKAPSVEAVAAANAAVNAAQNATETQGEEDKPNVLEQAWSTVTGWFKGEETTPEEAKEGVPTEDKNSVGEAVGKFISGEWVMDPEWVEEYEQREETPKISQEPGFTGMYASATVSDVPIVKPSQKKQYIEVKDDADVLRAYYAGKLDQVSDADKRGFLSLIQNQYAKQVLGLVADEESAKAALIGNEGAEMVGLSNLTSLGVKFYDAYSMINSESFPDELRDDGMLMLLNLTKRAALLEEQGALGGDEYLPAMERLLTTDKWAQAELEKLYGARDALIANKNGILTAQQRETDKAIQEAREAFIRGDASAEQVELVYASVPSDAPKKAYKDKTYKAMFDEVNYTDFGYFDEEGGAFYNSALYANLPKQDEETISEYKFGLSCKMVEMLQLDARAAASLGMSLEDFYSRVGGMTSETLANRASAQMVSEAKSVTQEDAVAFDEIKNDGSIGWFATGVLSTSHGTLSAYEAYADTLYMGVTEGNVIRTGEKMKIKYEQEYGAEGRETYRAEMQDYIDSGLLDEDYAKALQSALDNVGDVYSIGIDPEDAEGFIVRSGAWARRNLKMQEAYVTENGSEAEQEAFRLLSSNVNNAWQMAVSYAATTVAGAALGGAAATAKGLEKAGKIAQKIGFASGYSRGQWSESVEKRMSEGFDRNTAVWLGSLDTYGSYKANFMTFGNVLTRATGMDSLAGKAMDWLFKNPIGALKGQAAVRSFVSGVFAGVENVAEEVGDTFKEGLYQKGIDKWLVPVFQKANNGEDVRASDYLMATLQAFNPLEIAKYAAESAAETVNSAPEIAIQTSLFALAGAAGNAFNTYKGYRTAQGMPIKSDGLAGFDSVQMAADIVNGRSNDVAGFLDALKADCEDNRFITLFNEAAETSGLAHKTIMNLIRANGRDAQVKEIEAKNEQIAAHKEKAANSQNAIDTAVQSLNEAQTKIDNGTATDEDVQVVVDSTESIAKNKNGLDEANREAAQKGAEVKALQDEGMQEARAKAKKQQGAEETRMREVLLANKKAAIEDARQSLQKADDEYNAAIQSGADDATLEVLGARVVEASERLDELNDEIVETDEEVEMETPESEAESAQLEAYQQKELAQQEANDMKSVYSKLAKTAVYVDESQRANILAATGLKTLGQVNRKFGLNLKSEKGKASVSLDGSFFKDVAELAPGRIDAETAHPEEELIRIVERKKELKGMQASVGETAYEKYLPDGEFSATQDPIMQQISSQIYKRTGVEVVVAPLTGNVRALYDRANGRIVLSNKIGAGESMRKAAMHELTHYIEGSVGYATFKKAVLDAAYVRDKNGSMREADKKRIKETYSKSGIELDETSLEKELVAEATEKIINDPDGRIVQEILDSGDRGVLLRVKNKIEQFLARHKAKKAGNVDAYDAIRNAQKKLAEALKSAGKWAADAAADIDATVGLESEQTQFAMDNPNVQYSIAPNQFANETSQKLNTLSEETKAVLVGRGHEAVADSERMDEAWMTVKERGRDNLISELLDKPVSAWTPQDHVNAALCGVLAEDAGDLHAAAKIILKYDEAGTVAGQTLHVRNIIKRMSPEGALVETIKSANRENEKKGIPANSIPFGEDPPKTKVDVTDASGKRRKTPEKVAKIYDEATRLMNQMANLGGKVSYNNPWGLPLSEKKMALIKAFKLEHTKLAGTAYNVATIKQRQLAAIIAVNNEVEGSGLETVVQQLVAMDNGMAVVTSADMHYIRSQMSEFKAIEGADSSEPLTQAGKNALGRAWQAQDNVNIAGDMSKWSALRYANMLSSTATWKRNIASNMINKGLEGTAKRVAVGIDKSVAKKTGTRTVDVATKEERKAGKEAFAKEVAQTFVDYFVTHTDTGHGRKYGPSHTGRVFQSEFLEAYRNLVDFAMQIGDRPFYEQCYTEELAIVKRLGMKKTEMDTDGTVVTRTMTEAEMKEEAVARAVKRVFQEDGAIIDALNGIRGKNPTADLVLSTLLPFVKTPTNVAMRAIDYSPAGLAITIARRGLAGIDTGKAGSISQHDYVMNMGRGLTGTGLMLAGWALASAGLIGFGRGEEENKKRRNVLAALGEPYSMYIDIAGTKHEIDWALPMAASIAAGANFYKLREEGDGLMEAAFSAVLSGVGDQLFSTPMLSSMQDIFQGYDDTTDTLTRVATTSATSLLNQTFSPAILRAIAKYTDPYVRDTSDSNPVWQVIKQNVVQYYPVLRNMLPAKTDLTGDDTLQTDFYNLGQEYQNAAMRFLDSFFTPTATIGEKNDPELLALLELSRRANTTICLPEMLIGAKDYELEVTASYAKDLGYKKDKKGIPYTLSLTDGEKYRINQEYGDLLFNGSGTTKYIDANGKYVPVVGIRELMNSATWKAKEPDEQVKDIEAKIKEVKLLIMKKYTDEKKKNGEL